jgi:sugar phosphate isomerase/epimerase
MPSHIFTRRQMIATAASAAAGATLASALPLSNVSLGVTTDEIDDDPAVASRFLREFNLGWAEVRNVWGKYNTAQPLDKIRELRAIFDQHKIRTSVLGTGFFKIPLPDTNTAEGRATLDNQWSLLDTAMERATILGTGKIRVFAFTHGKGESPNPKHYPRIYELVSEAAARAKARNFRLAVENVGDSYVWTGAQAAELLKHVKAANLGLTWDPNNAGAAGEKSYPDGYKLLDPARIFHVHLRDFRKTANGEGFEWCAVGDGIMDNLNQIKSLLKSGYKESFTLETHYKSPQGKAHASRTSLTALLKVFENV